MKPSELEKFVHQVLEQIDRKIPEYKNSEEDWKISQGNVAVCIIDESGNIYGKIWGNDKLQGRKYFDVAYRKASQVWITGYKTGEFERLIFTDKLNYREFGIPLPELMGWEGGQPIRLDDTTIISCGFSGFKGTSDLKIVFNAVQFCLNNVN